jgi:hypothetical protein
MRLFAEFILKAYGRFFAEFTLGELKTRFLPAAGRLHFVQNDKQRAQNDKRRIQNDNLRHQSDGRLRKLRHNMRDAPFSIDTFSQWQ